MVLCFSSSSINVYKMFLKHLVISFTLLIYEIESKGGHLIECETAKGCVESMKKLGIEVQMNLEFFFSRTSKVLDTNFRMVKLFNMT